MNKRDKDKMINNLTNIAMESVTKRLLNKEITIDDLNISKDDNEQEK